MDTVEVVVEERLPHQRHPHPHNFVADQLRVLLVDGQLRPLGDARYLLSPGDLYALAQVPEIVEIGISTLKIEGRYKDADYVALTTAAIPPRP